MATVDHRSVSRFLSERARRIPPSGIRRFFDLISGVEGVISLGVGEPDFVTPDPIREAGIRSIREGHTSYTSNYGLLELRELLSEHLAARYGVRYDPHSEILITVGVSEALDIACRAVLGRGDRILVPDPSYVAYVPAVVMADAEPVMVPLSQRYEFEMRVEFLEPLLSPEVKALLLAYPNNPTGAVMPRHELEKLAAFAEEHDLLVISDEIYDRLTYGVEHTCFPSMPGMRERTILLGGFSKSYAMTGWRVGYVCAPADLIEAMMKIHQYTIMSAPTAAQYAAIEALKSGEPYVQQMRAEYDRRRKVMVSSLNEIGLPTFEPKGAFYVFPDITPTGLSSIEFVEQLLLQQKVVAVPGDVFGPSGEGHVRMCYATSMEQIEEALERINRFVHRL
ncbi:aminotransferase class I and II [Thermobaculum terrenum ATCC BAA-798]|uniref:Aminotransferase n=1 Tax=Thermobaculum terrenum (strain ATCC BAA-798 / CCMEE 7001 / YNP1) TaxID=525904 RepID=D1CCY6_THET1|nr:aminotransferase class I/II-fold pyridoxal phosphate-dependent enzyme [Thermobaculum terrenum]ACZ42651.1 aminotransferase class I and II [Thermobaculum terrenum ATCC BAA-798]